MNSTINRADEILATLTKPMPTPAKDARPVGERFPLGCLITRSNMPGTAGLLRHRVIGYGTQFGMVTLSVRHERADSPLYWIGSKPYFCTEMMAHDAEKVGD